MVFSSYIFILGFVPLTLLGFVLAKRIIGGRTAIAWLIACSLFFYGWWEPIYLLLIATSVLVNFAFGRWIDRCGAPRRKTALLILGVILNLGLLGYFKYTHFVVNTVNAAFGGDWLLDRIILPLAISFFTFQQIAYLVDVQRGVAHERSLLRYALFVTFFPQLIAGPIVHHRQVLPQIERSLRRPLRSADLSIGLTIFTIGLAKKVLLADGVAVWATPVFDMAAADQSVTILEAWAATFAYGFQIYFDFSGYSDMAIGLGRCFGLRLPLNFDSPYKSANIMQFWRRWHITLSVFLRDYLYIPLGGNQRGTMRRFANLMVTMLLGGLWHGAGWTFVIWGGLHGMYLVINHAFSALRRRLHLGAADGAGASLWGRAAGVLVTFLAVNIAWVFFRAESFEAAWLMLRTMLGFEGIEWITRVPAKNGQVWMIALPLIVWALPSTHQFMGRFRPAYAYRLRPTGGPQWWQWRPNALWAWLTIVLFMYTVWKIGSQAGEFIYYQF